MSEQFKAAIVVTSEGRLGIALSDFCKICGVSPDSLAGEIRKEIASESVEFEGLDADAIGPSLILSQRHATALGHSLEMADDDRAGLCDCIARAFVDAHVVMSDEIRRGVRPPAQG